MKKFIIYSVITFMATINVLASETKHLTSESKLLVELLGKEIDNTLLAISQIEALAGKNPENVSFSIEGTEQTILDLGMIIDSDEGAGVQVIAVSPQSLAERSGVKSGDVIVMINDKKLSSENFNGVLSELKAEEGEISLVLNRYGKDKKIIISTEKTYRPKYQLNVGTKKEFSDSIGSKGCGRISIFFEPPEAKMLFPAFIHKVDGNGVMRDKLTLKLRAGKHIVHLHELISKRYLSKRGGGVQQSKPIEIDVQANTNYYLAAKFLKEKSFKKFKEKYWEPVVWKKSKASCEL
ncbi:PDZ domain-containing protein [Colwelliaceae bacterium 6441]